jgi:hypothetical protein
MDQAKAWGRRDLLHATAGTALGLTAMRSALGETQPAEASGGGRPSPQAAGHLGEPYELAGKRLVFTSWHYIRPGSYGYFDGQGREIPLRGMAGPRDAHLHRFDGPRGIRLIARPAERTGPVLEPEHPWEEGGVTFNTMIRDGGIIRAWGGGYFESTDGIRWNRPELGLVEFRGNRRNNLLSVSPGSVFIDPACLPEERFKSVFLRDAQAEAYAAYRRRRPRDSQVLALDADPGRVHAVHGSVSPDGLRWSVLPEPIVVEHSDTHIVACYDERLGKYVMYTRNYPMRERTRKVPYDGFRDQWAVGRRSIGRSETEDFRNFPISEVILEPTPDMMPSDMLYSNCRTTIPGAPDHHLMFPAIWHTHTDTTSIALLSSHDGRLWNYIPGSPVLETAEFGKWDGGCVFATPNLVELPDYRWVLAYSGYNFPHKYPRGQLKSATGYAAWPNGRLVAVEAKDQGEFATVAFIPPGRKLCLNVVTERAGHVLVETIGYLEGKPLPGRTFADARPIIGDHRSAPVVWKEQDDLGHRDGNAVILRFRMDKARIFGLEFI